MTLDQLPPWIFLPPSSPNLAPASHSEPRAASLSIISLTWLVRKPTPSLQIRPGCSILYQVLKYTVKFLVALIAPTLSSHPFPAEAKPPLCSYSAQLTVAREDALESFEPSWLRKAVGVDRAVLCATSICPYSFHTSPYSHQKVKIIRMFFTVHCFVF